MTDGGTIWVELPPDCCAEDLRGPAGAGLSHLLPVLREYGRFAYLEGNLEGHDVRSQLNPFPLLSPGVFNLLWGCFSHPDGQEQHCS